MELKLKRGVVRFLEISYLILAVLASTYLATGLKVSWLVQLVFHDNIETRILYLRFFVFLVSLGLFAKVYSSLIRKRIRFLSIYGFEWIEEKSKKT